MISLSAWADTPQDTFRWSFTDDPDDPREGITIEFQRFGRIKRLEAIKEVFMMLHQSKIEWLTPSGKSGLLDLDKLAEYPLPAVTFRRVPKVPVRQTFTLPKLSWLWGRILVDPEVDQTVNGEPGTVVRFIVSKEEIEMERPKKIFLSHAGVDKPVVQEFEETLTILGFDPWLDEDAMTAGVPLERGILKGFEDSCAAVFFITPSFIDENYLASEVDYAIAEKRKKGDRFAIVTLVLEAEKGQRGQVPGLLRRYVWKEPKSHLEALQEIIRALPIKLSEAGWKQT